jgi:N-methylhydantoinase A
MIAATRVHIAERGRDPRRYALMAFGGMGPMHAHAVAQGLKIHEVICPASAGVLSAWGMLVAPTAFESARSLLGPLTEEHLARAEAVFAEMEAEAARLLTEAGVPRHEIRFQRSADMRYAGQIREITVPLPPRLEGPQALRGIFLDHYRQLFGHAHTDVPTELVTCRLVAASRPRVVPNRHGTTAQGDALKGQRLVYFAAAGNYVPTAVYDRYRLAPGSTLAGPAVVEERESTAVVPPGAFARVDEAWNLVIRLDGGA